MLSVLAATFRGEGMLSQLDLRSDHHPAISVDRPLSRPVFVVGEPGGGQRLREPLDAHPDFSCTARDAGVSTLIVMAGPYDMIRYYHLGVARWMSARGRQARISVSRSPAVHHDRPAVDIRDATEPTPRPASAIRDRFGVSGGEYVLFVGRLVPEHAPDLVIQAFRYLSDPVRLVIAGSLASTDPYVVKLRQMAKADPRIVFTDDVSGDLLAELYANAVALVLPARLEGLSLTLLEAASHGLPVVASDIPPHIEVLKREGPGQRIFSSNDVLELATALDRVLADPAGERAGAAGLRQRVLGTYRWEDVSTEHLYIRVLGRADEDIDVTELHEPRTVPVAES
jgi:glycosyltransferase involved in cell wall biosynthesis